MENENPTVEEPKVEEKVDDAQALMEELKKLDIQTPKDVQNMAFASQETGKAWNEVGSLRKEVDRLTQALQTQPKEDNYYDNESVDLGKVVEEKVQGVLNNYLENQQRAQQMAMKAMHEVKGDPEYQIVGQAFEKYINSPEAIYKLQTGQTDYKTEYLNTKASYYRNLAERSSKTLNGLMDKSQKTPVHMEQGESQNTPMMESEDERVQRLKNINKARGEGSLNSDEALEKIIKETMPDVGNDPSFFMP